MQNMNNKKVPGTWQRNALIALCAVLALILLALVFGTAYVHSLLNKMQYVAPEEEYTMSKQEASQQTSPDMETIDPSSTETLPQIGDVTVPTEPPFAPVKHGSHVVNILLVGQDRREGAGEYRQRSDSMILVSFNTSRNTITLTSFMRDQYVVIPGYGFNKLNAAYVFGGFNLLNKTLEQNLGVFVDGNVEVDFSSFTAIIEMLGGVEINLTQAEADYLNKGFGWNLVPGLNLLNGEQALNYARIREIDSDYQRSNRQRTVIISLINRYKNVPVSDMMNVLNAVLPMIRTNMTNDQILSYAGRFLPMLASARVDSMRIPVDGTFDSGYLQLDETHQDWFQYNIDFKTNYEILQQLFIKG